MDKSAQSSDQLKQSNQPPQTSQHDFSVKCEVGKTTVIGPRGSGQQTVTTFNGMTRAQIVDYKIKGNQEINY